MEIGRFATDFALAISAADALAPVAQNQRSKVCFQPGIGPHTEAQTLSLVAKALERSNGDLYREIRHDVPYGSDSRQRCDLLVGRGEDCWAIEAKLLRFLGDNGKPNDNMLMHILSPYEKHRSALTDCTKLAECELAPRKGVLIFGYDCEAWHLEPAICAFESLASLRVQLSPRCEATSSPLIHPVHNQAKVFAWEVLGH